MLLGPPMSGKSTFGRTFLHNSVKKGSAGILITSKDTGEAVVEWFESSGLKWNTGRLGIIDCVSRTLGLETYPADTESIKRVASSFDLTGISVRMGEFMEKFWREKGIREIVIVIETLSTLLMYSNLMAVLRFLHVFTGRIKSAGAVGLYLVEEGMHDSPTMTTMKQFFQGIIEMKEEKGRRLLHIVGSPRPTPWLEYRLEGAEISMKEV
jgi:KaiC/GvpD/RAD55 family RecA-like ATPase